VLQLNDSSHYTNSSALPQSQRARTRHVAHNEMKSHTC